MLEVIQKIAALLFLVASIYFGILGVIKVFVYPTEREIKERNRGAKLSANYLSLSVGSFFIAIEIYMLNVICIPLLLVFLGLIWFNYFVYSRTNSFLGR